MDFGRNHVCYISTKGLEISILGQSFAERAHLDFVWDDVYPRVKVLTSKGKELV